MIYTNCGYFGIIMMASAFRVEGQKRGVVVGIFGRRLLSEGFFSLSLLGYLTATPTSVCFFGMKDTNV